MKIVFGGAWALIVLGIILHFAEVDNAWVLFCIGFGVSIILLALKNAITFWIGIACLAVALISLVVALT